MTCWYWAATASLLVWAKMVETSALTGLDRAGPSLEVMLRAKWTRQRCQAAPGRIASGRGADAGVGVAGDQHDPLGVLVGGDPQPLLAQGPQEGGPEVGGLGVADSHAQDLATSLGRDPGGDHQGLGDHPVAQAYVEVGGVHEQVGEPGVVQWPGQKLRDSLADVLADP